MRFYDEEYFSNLKIRLANHDYTRLIRNLKYIAVSILFFFSWSNLIVSNATFGLMLVPLGIALPIVLLILVVQYSNKFAFLAVVFIFQFSIFHEFESLFKSLHSFLTQDRAIHWAFFGDPMKGFQDALIFIPLIFLALIILNNIFKQEKVAIYRQEYLISLVCALGLVLLSPVISNVINYIISFG